MGKPRNSSNKWTELEKRISSLESMINARLLRIEGSPAADTAKGNAGNVQHLNDGNLDESVDFTKQNVSTDCWKRQGARPKNKRALTSTPLWSDAVKPTVYEYHRAENYRYTQPITLQNRFQCLTDMEPVVPRKWQNLNSKNKARSRGRKQPPTPVNPTTLVVGDFTVENIGGESMVVCCFPYASISETTDNISKMLSNYKSIKRIIVHVGANDVFREQLTVRKSFKDLFSALNGLGMPFFISGPLPGSVIGNYGFSRLLSLNTWLAKTCFSSGINFIDNFNLFWKHKAFFSPNSTELSWTGAKVLADHYQHSVHHSMPTLGTLSDKRSVAALKGANNTDTNSVWVQTEPPRDINNGSKTVRKHTEVQTRAVNLQAERSGTNAHSDGYKQNSLSPMKATKPPATTEDHADSSAPNTVQENDQRVDLSPHTSPSLSKASNMISELTGKLAELSERQSDKQASPQPPETGNRQSPITAVDVTPSPSVSPSPPRLRFPEKMERLLSLSRVSLASPKGHSNQVPYTELSHGQALCTPKSLMIYPTATAPKKQRAPPPPVITDKTEGPCAQLQFTSSSEDLHVGTN
ncbi:uncharacterized protein LOC132883391 isoform X1 [Neoarius graeffei]|uniref:uncharacterized protein LOC132883391 isoform X1 n=1 Tax=Neoarius graeffei TaxID=443677 RepID=UPI00298C694D|nr:uncharacterized protein LOC132883391 isoform X1 [Neoarius graeffei]